MKLDIEKEEEERREKEKNSTTVYKLLFLLQIN